MITNNNEHFEVRKSECKNRFYLDNDFFDTYGRILGANALGVYCCLCRHADREQKSYPSQQKIAEELKLSEPTVNEWIKVLEYFCIIKKTRLGKQCTNRYWLLDKIKWRTDWTVMLTELSSPDFKWFKFRTKTILVHDLNGLSSNSNNTQEKQNPNESNIAKSKNEMININSFIDLFKPINPTYETLFKNITERLALQWMVNKFGEIKTGQIIKILPNFIYQPYAPRITKPSQLKNKLPELIAFIKQGQNKQKQREFIEI